MSWNATYGRTAHAPASHSACHDHTKLPACLLVWVWGSTLATFGRKGVPLQSRILTKQVKACINKFYGCFDLRVVFRSKHRIKSLFPYKNRLVRAQMSKVVYKASCLHCQEFYTGKTKRRLHDRKTEHFKSITSSNHSSVLPTMSRHGHNMKWYHFEIF